MNPSPLNGPVALVGAGLVGSSWAVVFARAGLEVRVHDLQPAQLERSREAVADAVGALSLAGLLREPPARVVARVSFEPRLEVALGDAVYVQESAVESLPVKRELFARLDAIAAPDAILASSTSAFATSSFADDLPGRARCLVAHPVNPPHLVPFVEVCPAPFTDPTVVDRTLALLDAVGQSPIHVRREIHGFVLNRLQWSLLGEAYRMVAAGVATPEDVDRAIRDGLGRRWAFMGPFEVGDLNAPGGLGDYLRRFGDTIEQIDASRQGNPLRLDAGLVDALDADARARWPQDARPARLEARDRRLLGLSAHLAGRIPTVDPDET